eukprot:7068754-Pyramimonas_sp.AAC.1
MSWMCRSGDEMCADDLCEVLAKVAGVALADATCRHLAAVLDLDAFRDALAAARKAELTLDPDPDAGAP